MKTITLKALKPCTVMLALSLANAKRLAAYGEDGQSWSKIIGKVLDRMEAAEAKLKELGQ